LARALGVGRHGTYAVVGAGGKTATIARLLHERPTALATTTTHLDRSGFGHGLLAVFANAGALARTAPELLHARPLTLALGAGARLQGPSLAWLQSFTQAKPQALVFVEADGARRRLVKLPAPHEPAWPPAPLQRVVLVVGLAALGQPAVRVAHRPRASTRTVELRDVQRMLRDYLGRMPPRAAVSVLFTGANTVAAPVLQGLVEFCMRVVQQRDPAVLDPGVALRVVAAADVAHGDCLYWHNRRSLRALSPQLPGVCCVLLAAGLGRRFGQGGGGKLLARWRGQPLAVHAAHRLRRAGFAAIVVVTGGDKSRIGPHLRAALGGAASRLRFVSNPNPARGLGSSVRLGARAVPAGMGMVFAHADMPAVRVATLRRISSMGSTLQHCIVRPMVGGVPRNPVYFPAALRGELMRVPDAVGGKAVLRRHRSRVLDLDCAPGDDLVDVDRPVDLAELNVRAQAAGHRGPKPRIKVLFIGCGDLGTGAAHALARAGFAVAIVERRRPLAIRRRVAFASAAQIGQVTVEGVVCRRTALAALARSGWTAPNAGKSIVPLFVEPLPRVLARLRPDVVVDARMSKQPMRALPAHFFRVALGPGHRVGRDCDAVVETARGPGLGQVLWSGAAAADTGVPGKVGGETVRRVLRAPSSGVWHTQSDIGARVEAGEIIAHVGRRPVRATLSGLIRGLLPHGERVRAGQKVGDIDPRPRPPQVHRISDKAHAVGAGVLRAVRTHMGVASGTADPRVLRPGRGRPSRRSNGLQRQRA